MDLKSFFIELAATFDGDLAIEKHARAALLNADVGDISLAGDPLPDPVLGVMQAPDAHPICSSIAQLPFQWAPPQTSSDPNYIAHSLAKVHVELLGPGGLVKSNDVRLGLYGMLPGAEYGIRTHPAEEIYVMFAGRCDWIRGDGPYVELGPNERSHHPSMMPHASRTRDHAFMSVYVWHGDVSTDGYTYEGLPADQS